MTTARPFPFPPSSDIGIGIEPLYAILRRDEPVSRIIMPYGGEAWIATRYHDVRTVLADPRFSRAAAQGDMPRMNQAPTYGGSVIDLDPPEHTRSRAFIRAAFTLRSVEQIRPRVQQIVDLAIDDILAGPQPADLVPALAQRIPLSVMSTTLGVPAADRDLFLSWSGTVLATTAASPDQITQARHDLHSYLTDLIDDRRAQPAQDQPGDLFGALVRANADGRGPTSSELLDLAGTLLIGSHATTIAHLAKSIYVLLAEPRHWRSLVTRPDVVPTAVEELLRYIPLGVGAGNPRVATQDLDLGGVRVGAGEAVVVARHSANRDETVFGRPDELDLTRDPNPHLGFGHGVHYCVGAQIARTELRVALGTLARRIPALALAVDPSDIPWNTGTRARSPMVLPVITAGR
jgi:cytochrome P450